MFFALRACLHGPPQPCRAAAGGSLAPRAPPPAPLFLRQTGKKARKCLAMSKNSLTFAPLSEGSPCLTGNRRDGRVVDYSSLENYRTERYRGFESLSLRKSKRRRRRLEASYARLCSSCKGGRFRFAPQYGLFRSLKRPVSRGETGRSAQRNGPAPPTRWLPGSWRQAASGCRGGTARPRQSLPRPPRKAVRGRRTGGTEDYKRLK